MNINAKNLIKYYCTMQVAPEYALLVNGPWGCGKSHLVKDCIDELKTANKDFKFLYVSLYGINDISDIEAKFFEQLNPILSNKKVMFASQIAKGVLKGALKIDLDGDGKADVTASVAVPDINLADYLTDTSNCILVFDDLERCAIDLQVIIGYMNYFIEKDGYKVVIIADEEKLIPVIAEENNAVNSYLNIKEKLIGKTVQIDADVSNVFDKFVGELFKANSTHSLVNNDIQELLLDHKARIIQIFKQSKHNNLRSLRKSFLDLKQWVDIFDKEIKDKHELLEHFFSLFIALSMEVHSGNIKATDFSRLIGLKFFINEHLATKKGEPPSELMLATKKYDFDFRDVLISEDDWVNFFTKGFIDTASVNEALKNTKYFLEESTPEWKRLWYLVELEDDEFIELKGAVQQSFDNREYFDLGEIKHVAGMFLDHIDKKLSDKTAKDIVDEVKQYLKDLAGTDNATICKNSIRNLKRFSGYANLGYTSANTDEFKDITTLINDFIDQELKNDLVKKSGELLKVILSQPETVTQLFDGSSREDSIYFDKPILQHIPVTEFLTAFLSMPNIDKGHFSNVLVKRYERVYREDELFIELNWLESLVNAIDDHLKSSDTTVSKVIMNFTHKNLAKVLRDAKQRTFVDEQD